MDEGGVVTSKEQEPAITEMIELVREVEVRMKARDDIKLDKRQRSKTRRSRLRRAVRRLLK